MRDKKTRNVTYINFYEIYVTIVYYLYHKNIFTDIHQWIILLFCFLACQGPFLRNWPADQSWIALIKRGNCTFNTKIANALGLKASGVLIYDHLESGQVLHNIKIDPFSIPSGNFTSFLNFHKMNTFWFHEFFFSVYLLLERARTFQTDSNLWIN